MSAGVEAFFASYRAAFERGDVDAIMGHFGESVHVASDTGSGVILETVAAPAWRAIVERLVGLYRRLGLGRAELRGLGVAGISPRLAQASAGWALFDRQGDPLYEFRALYTLIREGPSWRIAVIAHDELLRSRQYLDAEGRGPEGGQVGRAAAATASSRAEARGTEALGGDANAKTGISTEHYADGSPLLSGQPETQ